MLGHGTRDCETRGSVHSLVSRVSKSRVNMSRIYLVGYMGAGKTTAAKRIATRLGWDVADTDAMFEEKYRISIHDFFQK
ncbi:MAG: hypothetical protein IKI09_05745, partial [Bacteroidales bacterium]|nr:hypothetical protein [Bacteroidales bacterium]